MSLKSGQQLGLYEILEPLGKGGMGEVYLAEDTRLRRKVAIKLPAPELHSDQEAQEQILREARAAAALNHPNICTVHEVGQAEGRAYIAMEYVEGRTLSAALPPSGMPVDEVVRLGAQICDALAHAHESGVVHRDLKCANVMVTRDGRAKVLDFGLAGELDVEAREATLVSTQADGAGPIAGTLPYMAPEVLRGQRLDARSDLWAVGVILFETVSGRRPFRGATAYDVTTAILRDPPPDLPPGCPPGLAAVIGRCLQKASERRYQSASEVAAALHVLQSHGGQSSLAHAESHSSRGRTALAVLPLESLSGDPEQEYFADGMTDALIADLAKIRALKLISRTSVMQYKGVRKPLREIARELNVDSIVEGTVLRAGDRVRITAQLIDANTDEHLWAESYQRKIEDVLELQSDVARAISQAIEIAIRPEEQRELERARPKVDPRSHDAYLKGLHHSHRWSDEGFSKALEYYQWAIDIDPDNALAFSGIADCHILQGVFGLLPPDQCFPQAKSAAARALAIDDRLGEAHHSLATATFIFDRDWHGVEHGFRRAVELSPNTVTVLQGTAVYYVMNERFDEGLELAHRSVELDPLTNTVTQHLAFLLFCARRYEESLARLDRALQLQPDFVHSCAELAWNHAMLGHVAEAVGAAERTLRLPQATVDGYTMGTVGWVLATAGERARAEELLERMQKQKLSEDRWIDPVWLGLLHEGLGDREQALASLHEACALHAPALVYLKVFPMFDSVRDDARFPDLLAKIDAT